MATLAKLLQDEVVLRWEVSLPLRAQPDRTLLILPRLADELPGRLNVGSSWNLEETPEQQIVALAMTFVLGEPLAFGPQFKHLAHYKDGIWYLKTADIRLFGWFHVRDCFIAASVAIADQAKRLNLYRPLGDEVARRRDALPLDVPKFVAGDDPHAVVSNFT